MSTLAMKLSLLDKKDFQSSKAFAIFGLQHSLCQIAPLYWPEKLAQFGDFSAI